MRKILDSTRHLRGDMVSIAHTIVEAHGGRIGAENVPSGGAVFHVSLPLAAPR
ncbi:hypothetical protein QA649_04795 [Bradyrhizobium sp. CB1717]|uniref:hypothetical protein n=1 Tax=Bradyrhizobium sp. CB1717 TaxID=3039154 RepID=UPI0024B105E9|nr:hypothetical protein [Bradyrhizobium sp. CB1717]WFU25545.1 hypothetical protein QA649_04795 [Bradyrhizobium sp. CB1717]